MLSPKIVFEDKYFLCLNKPAGLVVNRSSTAKNSLQDWTERYLQLQNSKNAFSQRGGIVHRLDKETSGLLLVAKDEDTFYQLQKKFKERKIKKKYLGLVHGLMEEKKGRIEAPVGRLPWNRERFGVFPGGREAETYYKVLREYRREEEFYSLVEWMPKTGRTHQIRVHAKSIHHPIVSDSFYAGRKTARRDRTWCPRLFLHASYLAFQHPHTNRKIILRSPLPADLKEALGQLQNL